MEDHINVKLADMEMESAKERTNVFARLKSIQKRYANAFTMHALNHIINGTIAEKIFWASKLTVAIILAIYFSKDIFDSYSTYKTDTLINIEVQKSLQFPKVHICFGNAISTFADCTSASSKSYDKRECSKFKENGCKSFLNSSASNKPYNTSDFLDRASEEGTGICGQCLEVNRNGDLYQTATIEAMRYTMYLNISKLPIYLMISPPEDKIFIMSSLFNKINIKHFGDYHFELEKVTQIRLPFPYSNPSSRASRTIMFF